MRDFEDYCWRDLMTDEMRRIFAAYHRERGIASRPAVVVVHPHSGFTATVQATWHQEADRLVQEARRRRLPVFHSVPPVESATMKIAPVAGERICTRPCESAFFFSDLEAALTRANANGVIICGAPTSGAVRATAVEAKSYGYKVAIAEDTTGDEADLLHKMALFDVAHKYADVMTLDELLAALAKMPAAEALT